MLLINAAFVFNKFVYDSVRTRWHLHKLLDQQNCWETGNESRLKLLQEQIGPVSATNLKMPECYTNTSPKMAQPPIYQQKL